MSAIVAACRATGRSLRRAARDAARGAARRPLLPAAALGTLTICLLMSGLAALVAWNLGRLTAQWSGAGHMTIYLDDDTSSQRAAQIADAVRRLPGVVDATLVTPKDAHARMRTALAGRADVLDGIEEGFLPGSIDVRLRPGVGALLRAHPAFQRLSATAGVEEVDLHAETTERLDRLRALGVRGAIAVTILLALATLYLFVTTIRLGVEARRDELAVLRLVGGTERFVRAPFLIEGCLIGVCGAAIAAITLYGLYTTVAPRIAASLGVWLAAAPLSFLPVSVVALAIVGGGALGAAGARLAFSVERA